MTKNAREREPSGGRLLREILRANLLTRFNFLLVSLGIVVLVVGPARDGLFLGVVVANAAIGVAQEYRAARTLARLHVLADPKVTRWRDGQPETVTAADLAVGDVVEQRRGDQLPVDGTVVVADAFELDTSILTGEAEPITPSVGDTVHAGSLVVAGTARVRADAVGDDRLAKRIEREARQYDIVPSELRRTTDRLLAVISWIIVVLGPLLVVRQSLGSESWRESVRGTVAGMVALVPEGLVLLTSATFALGAIRLGRRRVLTQELPAIEMLARVDVLCLDKTGTLTTSQPLVSSLVVADGVDASDAATVEPAIAALARSDPDPNLTLAALRDAFTDDPGWQTRAAVAFSSSRRWGGADFGDAGAWVIGAPDVLVPEAPLPHGAAGHRVVVVGRAHDDLDATRTPGITPVAHVVLSEQLRANAPATIQYLRAQGVALKVFSGDHPATVAEVVAGAGVPVSHRADGRSLPSAPDEIAALAETADVIGRVAPHGKQSLVRGLRDRGHTVAMTGDGVNDVLALKEADVGLAMGSGAPAARAVSELVLLDDDFDAVPHIVEEGRRVLANVERISLFFLVKTTWAAVLVLLVVITGMPYPLFPSQTTLIGLLAIGMPAFLLSLRRDAPRFAPGMLARIVRRSVPVGMVTGIAGASSFAAARALSHGDLAPSRTATMITITVVGLVLVALNLGPRPGRWRLLPYVLSLAGLAIVSIAPLRALFAITLPRGRALGASLTIAAAAGALIIATRRFVFVDQTAAPLATGSDQYAGTSATAPRASRATADAVERMRPRR